MLHALIFHVFVSFVSIANGDYDCVCNYNVELPVLPSADDTAPPIGYMYEFDCKPLSGIQAPRNYYTLQFEKQLGFVKTNSQVKIQTCPGSPPDEDLIPTTTIAQTTIIFTEEIKITTPHQPSTTTTPQQRTPISSKQTFTSTSATTTTQTENFQLTTTTTTTSLPPTTTTTTPKPTTTTTPQPTTTSTTTPLPTSTTTTPKPTTRTTTPQPTTTTTTTTPQPTTTSTTTPLPTTTTTTPKPTTRTTTPKPTTTTTTTTPQPTTTAITTTPKPTPTTTTPQTRSFTTTPPPITTISSTTTPTTTATTTTLKPTIVTVTISTQLTTKKSTIYGWSSAANVSGTPFQYVGVGYNLLTENPESEFHTTYRVLQLTGTPNNVHEATYENHASCLPQKTTTLLHGSKAYQDELKTLVRPSSSHNVQLSQAAFTYNNQFRSDQQVLDGSTNLYIDVITTCKLGTVRYTTDNASQGNFVVTRDFATDVCTLPKVLTLSSTAKYMQFLDKWGTSIVTSVDLGTKQLERYTTTAQDVFNHVQRTDSALLEHHGQFEEFSSSVIINTQTFGNSHASSTPFGSRKELVMGTSQHQIPFGGDLVPIVDALDKVYWNTILDQLVGHGICEDSIYVNDLDLYKTNFQLALIQYPGYKNSQQPHTGLLDRPTLQLPIIWPSGTYGLMKAASGCPMNNAHWEEGWRRQDTELTNNKNDHSPDILTYMSVILNGRFVTTSFCMKTNIHSISGSQYDQQWPSGAYCILKKGLCPTGFAEGYVNWDDEDVPNHNNQGGTLPDGNYDKNTKIYFCCRNDGSPNSPVFLPTDRPFILVRYGNTCQAVHGMNVHNVFIKWDDEDLTNKDSAGGMHPSDDGGSHNHLLHYCYYHSANSPSLIG